MRILARGVCVLWLQWTNSHRVLWRKRDCTATLSRRDHFGAPRPLSQDESILTLALTGFYCFSGHITLRMLLIYYVQVPFRWLQKIKERMLLITLKGWIFTNVKGKVIELVTLSLEGLA